MSNQKFRYALLEQKSHLIIHTHPVHTSRCGNLLNAIMSVRNALHIVVQPVTLVVVRADGRLGPIDHVDLVILEREG
jgi:hypothetical protein